MRWAEKYRKQGKDSVADFCEKTANDVKRNAELAGMRYTSDVLIRCQSCGFIASEHEFATYVEETPLSCPECKETTELEDFKETCETCAYHDACEVRGDLVTWCKAWAYR